MQEGREARRPAQSQVRASEGLGQGPPVSMAEEGGLRDKSPGKIRRCSRVERWVGRGRSLERAALKERHPRPYPSGLKTRVTERLQLQQRLGNRSFLRCDFCQRL